MPQKAKVFVNPNSSILFSSFYIHGLYKVFGKKRVLFSGQYFKDLKQAETQRCFDHYMAFVCIEGKNIKKFIVDFDDKTEIDDDAYKWCDRYAKINYNPNETEKRHAQKLFPIPPGFGIKIWGKVETYGHLLLNWIKQKGNALVKFSVLKEDYLAQFYRGSINDYKAVKYKNRSIPYVFMIGRVWTHDNCLQYTNPLRFEFIKACKSLGIDFEGGLFCSNNHPEYEKYKEFSFSKKMGINEYIDKSKASAFCFNTPAVYDCHGWKMGEYLAMGKAIVTTPLSNYFPHIEGKEEPFMVISKESNMDSVLKELITSEEKISKLEKLSISYYEQYASPERVIEHIVKV